MATEMFRHLRQHSMTLDPYLPEPRKASSVAITNVNLIAVSLTTKPAKRGLMYKVDELVMAVRDLEVQEKYALDSKLYYTLVLRGVVESEDEYMRFKKIAHYTGRIREHAVINGAWVTARD